MDLAYAAADLAICRSGAMTVAEVSAVGLPAVYVPLPIGNGEQRLNALPVVDAGGGLIVDDADLSPDFVADTVGGLITDAPRLAAMTAAAALVGHRDAAEQVARVALDVARAVRAGRTTERTTMTAPLPEELRRVHMVGHRRCGHVGHRAHPAGPRRAGVGVGRQGVARGGRAARPRCARSGSGTTRRRWTCCPAVRPR